MINYRKMETADVKVKKWGNSLGVILPKEILVNQDIKEGSNVEIIVRPKTKTKVKDIFGILRGKLGDTEELMSEVNKELWGINN
jgi:antitoxin component of MazEF toxin-antitoxin module